MLYNVCMKKEMKKYNEKCYRNLLMPKPEISTYDTYTIFFIQFQWIISEINPKKKIENSNLSNKTHLWARD